MNSTTSRYLLSTAALLALVGTAPAAAIPEITDCQNITTVYKADGTAGQFYGGTGAEMLYDGDFENGVIQNDAGSYFVIDFTIWNTNGYYVSEVTVGHLGNVPYTIQYSLNGTVWLPLTGAENVTTSGRTAYDVKDTVKKLKYIFVAVEERDESLTEFQVKGYEPPEMAIVSRYNLTSWYNADGSAMASNGGGGTGNPAAVFNGRTGDYQMFPRCGNGGYFIVDFSTEMPGGYYIEKVLVDTTGQKRYTVYTSTDGTNWTVVPGANGVKAAGIATYSVGAVAAYVKYVFNDQQIVAFEIDIKVFDYLNCTGGFCSAAVARYGHEIYPAGNFDLTDKIRHKHDRALEYSHHK